MGREFARSERLGGQVLRVLNDLLLRESKDPRLDGVSISAVDLSRDLSVARVYYSSLDTEADTAAIDAGLASAAGFLRARVGTALGIRHAPELRFRHDDSIARGLAITGLIDAADKGDGEPQ